MYTLTELEKQAVTVIKLAAAAAADKGQTLELCYSGGKDSEVMRVLAIMAGVPFEAIYKQTTIDRPFTTMYCQSRHVTILHPPVTFLDLVRKKGYPTRRCRWCCERFKEFKVRDVALVGVRRDESRARRNRYTDFDQCRVYHRGGSCQQFFPLLNWSELDELDFIRQNALELHPHYYDDNGQLVITRRLGCLGCPLRGDNGRGGFQEYPKMLKQWLLAGIDWYAANPQRKTCQKFSHPAKLLLHNLFCRSYQEYYDRFEHSIFGFSNDEAIKVLEFKFSIDLSDIPR